MQPTGLDRAFYRKQFLQLLLHKAGIDTFRDNIDDLAEMSDQQVEQALSQEGLNVPWLLYTTKRTLADIERNVDIYLSSYEIMDDVLSMSDDEVNTELEMHDLDSHSLLELVASVDGSPMNRISKEAREVLDELVEMSDEEVDQALDKAGYNRDDLPTP